MDNHQKEELRSYLGTYLEETHNPAKERGKWNCVCGSSDALHYYANSNSWKCFSCEASGDLMALYAMDNGLDSKRDFKQITEALSVRYGVSIGTTTEATAPRIEKPSAVKKSVDHSAFIATATAQLFSEDGASVREYLISRAISKPTAERFSLGAAVINEKLALVIPTTDGKSYNARIIEPGDGNKYSRPYGSSVEIYEALQDGVTDGPLWLVEGEINAISIWQAGGSAIAIGGVSNTDKAIAYVKQHSKLAPFVLAFDMDKAGTKATATIRKALEAADLNCYEYPRTDGDGRDINDILQDDPSELSTMVMNVKRWQGLSATAIAKVQAADGLACFDKALSDIAAGVYSTIYKTPFQELNAALVGGGLHPGLTVLGAGTGAGKTTYVLQIAAHLAEHGQRVLYISLEMAAVELYTRMLSRILAERGCATKSALQLRLDSNLQESIQIKSAIDYLRANIAPQFNIYEGVGDFSAAEVAELAKYYTAQDGRPPVVIIDYLQLLATTDPRLSDKQATDANVRIIKRMARDLNCLCIAISSYNRDSYGQAGASLKAFKESGAIEYTADLVLALEATEELQGVDNRAIILHLLKNRDGRKGIKLGYSYRPAVNLFTETELEEEMPLTRFKAEGNCKSESCPTFYTC